VQLRLSCADRGEQPGRQLGPYSIIQMSSASFLQRYPEFEEWRELRYGDKCDDLEEENPAGMAENVVPIAAAKPSAKSVKGSR
jgi:hypothetical protein